MRVSPADSAISRWLCLAVPTLVLLVVSPLFWQLSFWLLPPCVLLVLWVARADFYMCRAVLETSECKLHRYPDGEIEPCQLVALLSSRWLVAVQLEQENGRRNWLLFFCDNLPSAEFREMRLELARCRDAVQS